MPKLSPEELAGAEVVGKLSPEDMASAEPVGRKSKYPGPKNVSDAEAGVESGPVKTEGINYGVAYGLAPHEVNAYEAMGPAEKENFKRQRDEAGKAFIKEIAGQTLGSAIIPVGEGIGAPIGRRILAGAPKIAASATSAAEKAAPKTFDIIKKAIEHSQHKGGILAGALAVGSDAMALTAKAGSGVASGVGAVAPAVATAAGGGAAMSPLSNAVDKLRASVGVSPSARDFTARLDAAKAGTVTQGTLGGGE